MSVFAENGWGVAVGRAALLVAAGLLAIVVLISLVVLIVKALLGFFGMPPVAESGVDQHAVVTGGSSGIGLEISRIYLHKGYRVTIVGRNQARLADARADLCKAAHDNKVIQSLAKLANVDMNNVASFDEFINGRILTVSLDVAAGEEIVKSALQPAFDSFGVPHVLINCAGISIAGEFDALPAEEFERMLRTNVLGSVYPTRAVVPLMKERRRGSIVFVSSQVAQVAIHGYSAYGASKWALRGLGEALQQELKPFNITVTLSYPPDTDTPGYKEEMLGKPSLTKELSESGSVFTAEQVAQSIVDGAAAGHFGVSVGLDGWLLKQVHAGMTPVNNVSEALQQILFASLGRIISIFVVLSWDVTIALSARRDRENKKKD